MNERILVFDTETTGLFKNRYGSDPSDPHIIQFSYLIYHNGKIVETWDRYIKVKKDVTITDEITNITGITPKMCNERGVNIVDALSDFIRAYSRVDKIIAHNIEFDKRVVRTEIKRNMAALLPKFPNCLAMFTQNFENAPAEHCTVKSGRNFCLIPRMNSRGIYYKNPKLSELHEALFGVVPPNLHNSLVDCEVCLKCYLELRKLGL